MHIQTLMLVAVYLLLVLSLGYGYPYPDVRTSYISTLNASITTHIAQHEHVLELVSLLELCISTSNTTTIGMKCIRVKIFVGSIETVDVRSMANHQTLAKCIQVTAEYMPTCPQTTP